jgi:transposase
MNALSNDLRTKILEHYEYIPEATYKSTANHFDVGEASVSRLVRHFRETGNVAPNLPRPKAHHKIDLDWLRDKIKNGMNKLLRELVLEYKIERNIKVAISSMWSALKSLGMSYKKNSYSQRKRI